LFIIPPPPYWCSHCATDHHDREPCLFVEQLLALDADQAWRGSYVKNKNVSSRPPPQPAPKPKPKRVLQTIRREGPAWVYDTQQTGPRMIRGIASTPTVDSYNGSLTPTGCQLKFPIPLKSSHCEGQIGDVVRVQIEPKQVVIHGLIWTTAAADFAWDLVRQGEVRCLSVGTVSLRKTVVEELTFIERWLLAEVSICRRGANPDCSFEVNTR
jgi:hypothetical protein